MDLLDALAEPALVVEGTRVSFANTAARALLGEHVRDEDLRLTLRHPAAVALLESGRAGEIEIPGARGPGSRLRLRVADGGRGRRLVQLADVTAQVAAERARTDFVANASHELRTPLTAIRGFLETLQDNETAADPVLRARFLGIVASEASRMERLIEDLIELSRIEADRSVRPDAPVEAGQLVADVLQPLRLPDGSADPRIVVDVPAGLRVRGDPVQLAQVLRNLVDNARRYGGTGTIRVSAAEVGREVVIAVADQGPGIAREHLPRLTERFYRVDAARSRETGGTGLGLAIVKHIVERHRGTLRIDSKVGAGTAVTVALPTA